MALDESVRGTIEQLIADNSVVVFMKGTRSFPQCGFSAAVVQVMQELKVPFKDINVLSQPALRDGIKEFTNWPTIPQVYVKGEFVGGCDIVREMFQTGELKTLLTDAGVIAAE